MLSPSKTHKEDTAKFYNISVFVLKHHLYLYLQSSDRRALEPICKVVTLSPTQIADRHNIG